MLLKRLSILEDSVIIFFASVCITILNIILSSHFISLLFVGIEFILFTKALRRGYYYALFSVVVTFLIVENLNGFKPFSLSLLSYFIYLFILPMTNKFFSTLEVKRQLFAVTFYIFLFLLLSIVYELNISLIFLVITNIIVDFTILGLLL